MQYLCTCGSVHLCSVYTCQRLCVHQAMFTYNLTVSNSLASEAHQQIIHRLSLVNETWQVNLKMSKQCYNSDTGQYRTGYAYSYQDSCVELHQDGAQGVHGGHRRHSGDRSTDSWIIQLKCESLISSSHSKWFLSDWQTLALWTAFESDWQNFVEPESLFQCHEWPRSSGCWSCTRWWWRAWGSSSPSPGPASMSTCSASPNCQSWDSKGELSNKIGRTWNKIGNTSKYLHCLQKSKIMESGNDCDPGVIVIMMERTQSDTQSKVSCCVARPAGLTLITTDGDYLEPFFPFYSI